MPSPLWLRTGSWIAWAAESAWLPVATHRPDTRCASPRPSPVAWQFRPPLRYDDGYGKRKNGSPGASPGAHAWLDCGDHACNRWESTWTRRSFCTNATSRMATPQWRQCVRPCLALPASVVRRERRYQPYCEARMGGSCLRESLGGLHGVPGDAER